MSEDVKLLGVKKLPKPEQDVKLLGVRKLDNAGPAVKRVPTLQEYQQAIQQALALPEAEDVGIRTRCSCGSSLAKASLQHYPHGAGYPVLVDAEVKYLWLYLHCPGCGYDWALGKTRIPLPGRR